MHFRILLIDDDKDLASHLIKSLKAQGYGVDWAATGAQALELMQRHHYGLALCDIHLPDTNGLDLLEQLLAQNPEIQVLMMTADACIESAIASMKKGAVDFLQKPFSFRRLLVLLEKAAEKSDLQHTMAIYEASKRDLRSTRLDVLMPAIVNICKQVLRIDSVCMALINEHGEWTMCAYVGRDDSLRQDTLLAIKESFAVFPADQGARPLYNGVLKPLVLDGQLLGGIAAFRHNRDDVLTPMDIRCLGVLCSHVSHAVGNANLYGELTGKVHELQAAQKKLEEAQQQVIHSEKMAAMGQLAAGVAHELNNPLSGILGFAQLLLAGRDLTTQQREDLETIETQAKRCRSIIRELLEFSRTRKPKMEYVDLVPLMRSTLHLVAYEFSTSGVELLLELPSELPVVYGDAHQLQQVFMNLITNARHALQGKKSASLRISAHVESGAMRLRFADNGTGIREEILGKIFDPFFTTKPAGQGTGLGLSICRSIMEEHLGTLSVESQWGEGTVFTVQLPIAPEAAKPKAQEEAVHVF